MASDDLAPPASGSNSRRSPRAEDYRALAMSSSRDGFVATCSFHFLLGKGSLHPPINPRRTQKVATGASDYGDEVEITMVDSGTDPGAERPAEPPVLAVRKVKDVFPNMITVGRTANNDLVIQDVSVSRFHAVFNLDGDNVLLSDAGSRNGTFVDRKKLAPRAPAVPVEPGSVVKFGKVEFFLVSAATLWDRLHR